MLPRDVISIISQYNEEGIFLIVAVKSKRNQIYWFNGKKWSYYCDGYDDLLTAIYYNKSLYLRSFSGYLFKYKNNKWVKLADINLSDSLLIGLTSWGKAQIGNYSYRWNDVIERIYGHCHYHGKLLQPTYRKTSNCHLVVFKHWLYVFDSNHNEKFNTATNVWIEFPCINKKILLAFLFNNLFYLIFDAITITFDPINDTYKQTNIHLPFKPMLPMCIG